MQNITVLWQESIESPKWTVNRNELPNHIEMKHCYSEDTLSQTESQQVSFVLLKRTA